MLGIAVTLVVSWILVRAVAREDLGVLGLVPTPRRVLQFIIGFFFVGSVALLQVMLEGLFRSVEWRIVSAVDGSLIGASLWYHLKSALTEELVFRGVILWLLIMKLGATKALWIGALAFGIYHWFSFGMLGAGPVPMIYVLVTTGLTGYVWGYAYWRTGSVLMPLGFHLAWNFMMTLFYPTQPYGELLFEQVSQTTSEGLGGLIFSIARGLAPPLLTWLFVRYVVDRFFARDRDDSSSVNVRRAEPLAEPGLEPPPQNQPPAV